MFSNEIKNQLKDIFSKINKKIIVLYFSEGKAESIGIRQRFVNFSANRFISLFETIAKKYILSESL